MTGPQVEGTGPPTGRPEPARRLFFALWPDPTMLERSQEAVRRHVLTGAGRAQRADQLHLTLEFLGSVAESRLHAVHECGARAATAASSFVVALDRMEHWHRPQVLCLTATATPEPLVTLVERLRTELAARGFRPEQRPYKAHLTLARQVRRPPPIALVEPLAWPARELSLVESQTGPGGSRYERLATWPLGP